MRQLLEKFRIVAERSVLVLTFVASGAAGVRADDLAPQGLNEKMRWMEPRAASRLLSNVSRTDAKPGSVIASPTKREPNYYFHWVRDGALTMLSIEGIESRAQAPAEKEKLRAILRDYVGFSEITQAIAESSNSYAEARFQVDGTIAHDGWASPQTDGPALRAVSLIHLANRLLDEGQNEYVSQHLYRAGLPAATSIKKDLEFVSHHWRDVSYDVWEESFGTHFYHAMVQRRSLIEGAELAARLGDNEAAGFYRLTANDIAQSIAQFYDANKGYIVATLNRQNGVSYKTSNLDSVVILGILHGATNDGFMNATDDRVLKTIAKIESAFAQLYPINSGAVVPAVGRYPEDRYDGSNPEAQGNPWFLTTFAMSEIYSKIADEMMSRGSLAVTQDNLEFYRSIMGDVVAGQTLGSRHPGFKAGVAKALAKADAYMESALAHMDQSSGHMSEQFHRSSGYMQGAADLTWSYASFFTADWALQNAHRRAASLR